MKRPSRPPALPGVLQRRETDEFRAGPYGNRDRRAIARVVERGPRDAHRLGLSLADYWSGRRGTAAGLLALNEQFGERFYEVPGEAALGTEAAAEALGGDELVIDVQTHYVADRPELGDIRGFLHEVYGELAPKWWRGIEGVEAFDLAEYLRCVFVESDTAVAVLTSGPGVSAERMLFNDELAGTREMLERLEAGGRLLNHCVVHANLPEEVRAMEREIERLRPVGWKVYTMGAPREDGEPGSGWWLDDERTGVPFIEKALEVGVPLICAHKGISALVDNGSPRDVGPAARAFPDATFVIYHSGWEYPTGEAAEEGPYLPETTDSGVNRLLHSLELAGLGRGCNVYAELGSTWFGLIRRPDEAAHVLGKLLVALGPDNVIWGTDAIWYGPSQVAIDAFRAFQIPTSVRERFGYPELTPEIKAKILGGNAARVYGIDPEQARRTARSDDLAWIKAALAEYRSRGVPLAGG